MSDSEVKTHGEMMKQTGAAGRPIHTLWLLPFRPTASQPCCSLAGRLFCGFGTRQRPGRERKVYGYVCLFSSKPTSALFFCEPATVGKLQECKVSLFVPSALHLPASQAGNRAASHRPHEWLHFLRAALPAHCLTVMPSCIGVLCRPSVM